MSGKPPDAALMALVEVKRDLEKELRERDRELTEALDVIHEYIYGGAGRWLEPDIDPFVALLRKHGKRP